MSNPIKKIAVFTSGGDAPGMNAAIRAVVRGGLYHNFRVYGIKRGYEGMIDGKIFEMNSRSVSNIIHRGGTILKSARSETFKTEEGMHQAYKQLKAFDIDAVVAIGGDGTFTGASIFSKKYDIPFIGIPGTIDNDLYGTDFTIGYDTASNTVVEAIDKIRDTAASHNRLFFIEVMGRDAGFIALNSGIAGGAEAILLPEKGTETNIEELVNILDNGAKQKKTSSMVIVAEGNPSGGAIEIANKVKERFNYYDTKVTILGHLQRGGSPTCFDRVLAGHLGLGVIEGLLAGEKNMMAGMVNNEIKFTSFHDAINNFKRLDSHALKMSKILAM